MTALQTTGLGNFSPVVVAPSYNNAQTLGDILHRLEALDLPVIVVDDGSTDNTAQLLANWAQSQSSDRRVLSHPHNRGKAAALRTAFGFAHSAGFTHAVTIDTDGQLAPEDIPPLLDRAKRRPDALIIGVRDTTSQGYPAMNRLGRWASNTLVWMESGVHVVDSQCGLRVYPLEFATSAKCRSEYFGFETEIITQAGWTDRAVLGEPVSCQYPPADQRVSHFKPWVDSLRATRMHLRLMSGALIPWPVTAVSPSGELFRRPTVLRRFLRWMNPLTAWRQVRGDTAGRTRFAAGFALGVFIANLPLYGVQTLISLFLARRFKLHPLSIVAGSNISMPPVGPLLIVGGITVGHLMLHGSLPVLADYTSMRSGVAGVLLPLLGEWIIGGIVLGALLAGVSFLCLDFLLRATTGGWSIKTPEPVE
jgi:glycosyltransferase involved in cell wall biosynthesis